jgi:hypothetical protein
VHASARNPNVTRRPQKTEEGQGQQAKEEYMASLQEVPSQEAPSSQTGQVHVEQNVKGLPVQSDLQLAQSGIQTTPQICCQDKWVCKQG